MNIKNYFFNLFSDKSTDNPERRSFFYKILAGSSIATLGFSHSAKAHKVEIQGEKEERFPGDPAEHFLAFPFNHPDQEYHQHVLGSVGAMIAKYEDNVDQVVVCYGKGIHILLKQPIRSVDESIKAKVISLAGQGVKFHACNRTLTSLELGKEDVLPFVNIVDVGAADIMELQENNYALMVW